MDDVAEAYWRPAIAVLLDESRRAIDSQMRELGELRGRAGNLIGYAGLALSIALATHPHLSTSKALWPGLALLAVVACALWILLPIDLHYELSAKALAEVIRGERSPSQAMERVALFHEENYDKNRGVLTTLHRVYFAGAVALVVELILLVLVLL